MFFELDGQTYRIKFFRMGNSTIAELYQVEYEGVAGEENKGLFSLGVYGVALLHHNDHFVKKVGRKVALSHLLESLTDHYEKDSNGESFLVLSVGPITLQKSDREMIWKKYFESHKK